MGNKLVKLREVLPSWNSHQTTDTPAVESDQTTTSEMIRSNTIRSPELVQGFRTLDTPCIDKLAQIKIIKRILCRFLLVQREQAVETMVDFDDPFASAPAEWRPDLEELSKKRPSRYVFRVQFYLGMILRCLFEISKLYFLIPRKAMMDKENSFVPSHQDLYRPSPYSTKKDTDLARKLIEMGTKALKDRKQIN